MSDNETVIGDEMIEMKLKEISDKLNISSDELIDRYIRRGLFMDDHYEPPEYTREELIERGRKAVEKDIKNGIPPKKHNFDVLVGRWDKYD
jgi:hypothetical protein